MHLKKLTSPEIVLLRETQTVIVMEPRVNAARAESPPRRRVRRPVGVVGLVVELDPRRLAALHPQLYIQSPHERSSLRAVQHDVVPEFELLEPIGKCVRLAVDVVDDNAVEEAPAVEAPPTPAKKEALPAFALDFGNGA